MIGAEIDMGNSEVGGKGEPFSSGEGVGNVGGTGAETEAFVAYGYHVVGVKRFDVGGGCGGPVCNDGCCAGVAAGLVGKLPGEDGGGGLVAGDDGADVLLVLGLGCAGGVPSLIIGKAIIGYISSHATIIGLGRFSSLSWGKNRGWQITQLFTKLMIRLTPCASAELTT